MIVDGNWPDCVSCDGLLIVGGPGFQVVFDGWWAMVIEWLVVDVRYERFVIKHFQIDLVLYNKKHLSAIHLAQSI